MTGLNYITNDELLPFIPEYHLQELDTFDNRRIELCEKYAISDIKEKLSASYDIDAELAKTGNDRPDYLVKMVAKLTTCYLYKHTFIDVMPEWLNSLRMEAYGSLKKVGTGGAEGILTPRLDEEGEEQQMRPMTQNKKRRNHFA